MAKVFIFLAVLFSSPPPGVLPERDWLRRGVAQYRNGAYGEAEVSFRRALAIRPGFAQANYNLAHALYRQQRYAESLEYYRQAQPNLPKNAWAQVRYNQANALLQLNRLPEAANAYRQALRLHPGFTNAQKNLSYVLLKITVQTHKKDVIRNATQAPKKPGDPAEKNNKPAENESAQKPPDSKATESSSQSKSQIQSPQAQLSQPYMENLLKQLDQAEKQIRGRATKAKAEKNGKTEEKDW